MVYTGHVKNGVILADDPVELPEGAVIRFEIASEPGRVENSEAPFAERFAEVMGKAQSLPEDAAENHDHYLYGVPKK
ncbi:MAG TPA: hypothetical protein VMZ06_15545 [Candidatus Bathyarchaeia archaeon]|nr:hypothetical protein [Candidatus Bathyarchaeia archaeon]